MTNNIRLLLALIIFNIALIFLAGWGVYQFSPHGEPEKFREKTNVFSCVRPSGSGSWLPCKAWANNFGFRKEIHKTIKEELDGHTHPKGFAHPVEVDKYKNPVFHRGDSSTDI